MLEFLRMLGVDTGGFDRWEIAFTGADHSLAVALAVAALLAALLLTRSSLAGLSPGWKRKLLLAWQILTVVLLVLVMLRPAIRLNKVAKVKDRVTVLLDSSASMTLPSGEDGKSRAGEMAGFFEDNSRFFDRLEEDYSVTYLDFDLEVNETAGRAEPPEPDGSGTDILAALSKTGMAGASSSLAGVILLSDGADTRTLSAAAGKARPLSEQLEEFPAPVNTVRLGTDSQVKDVSIVSIQHDDYGFVHNPFEVLVRVRAEGGIVKSVPVIFKQGDKVLVTKTMTILPGEKEAEAVLGFTPRQVGEFMFSVEVPPVEGELTLENNVARFPLKVLRDKVRVLYVVGNPSWDEKFLRRTMKKNPSVDMVSFYILREHWDDHESSREEVSLIPFPTEKLFMEELDTFDLVIWQNFRGFI